MSELDPADDPNTSWQPTDREAGLGIQAGPRPDFGGESKCCARPARCRGMCSGECMARASGEDGPI